LAKGGRLAVEAVDRRLHHHALKHVKPHQIEHPARRHRQESDGGAAGDGRALAQPHDGAGRPDHDRRRAEKDRCVFSNSREGALDHTPEVELAAPAGGLPRPGRRSDRLKYEDLGRLQIRARHEIDLLPALWRQGCPHLRSIEQIARRIVAQDRSHPGCLIECQNLTTHDHAPECSHIRPIDVAAD